MPEIKVGIDLNVDQSLERYIQMAKQGEASLGQMKQAAGGDLGTGSAAMGVIKTRQEEAKRRFDYNQQVIRDRTVSEEKRKNAILENKSIKEYSGILERQKRNVVGDAKRIQQQGQTVDRLSHAGQLLASGDPIHAPGGLASLGRGVLQNKLAQQQAEVDAGQRKGVNPMLMRAAGAAAVVAGVALVGGAIYGAATSEEDSRKKVLESYRRDRSFAGKNGKTGGDVEKDRAAIEEKFKLLGISGQEGLSLAASMRRNPNITGANSETYADIAASLQEKFGFQGVSTGTQLQLAGLTQNAGAGAVGLGDEIMNATARQGATEKVSGNLEEYFKQSLQVLEDLRRIGQVSNKDARTQKLDLLAKLEKNDSFAGRGAQVMAAATGGTKALVGSGSAKEQMVMETLMGGGLDYWGAKSAMRKGLTAPQMKAVSKTLEKRGFKEEMLNEVLMDIFQQQSHEDAAGLIESAGTDAVAGQKDAEKIIKDRGTGYDKYAATGVLYKEGTRQFIAGAKGIPFRVLSALAGEKATKTTKEMSAMYEDSYLGRMKNEYGIGEGGQRFSAKEVYESIKNTGAFNAYVSKATQKATIEGEGGKGVDTKVEKERFAGYMNELIKMILEKGMKPLEIENAFKGLMLRIDTSAGTGTFESAPDTGRK